MSSKRDVGEKYREYIVTFDAEWRGCTTVVLAFSEEDALNLVSAFRCKDIDKSGAELVNWWPRKAELNE